MSPPNEIAENSRGLIAIRPARAPLNRFVDLFAASIEHQGFTVRELRWRLSFLRRARAVIIHWPTEFTAFDSAGSVLAARVKLLMMKAASRLFGTSFIWVAHNRAPHDTTPRHRSITRAFMGALSGVIYLSAESRTLVEAHIPEVRGKPALVTAHGHYRDSAATPASAPPLVGEPARLAFVGLIRPYKNLEVLARAIAEAADTACVTIAGMKFSPAVAEVLERVAASSPAVRLDLRDGAFSDAEFEAVVDASDAVVLPYREILNSGAALLALSRNRPVIAPRIGSMPDLQRSVGKDWVYLYDGAFDSGVVRDAVRWLRDTSRGPEAPLGSFDWEIIGAAIADFVTRLHRR